MAFPVALPDWSNLAVLHTNALPARAHFYSYASETAALTHDRHQSEYHSLNGTWKFHYAASPFEAPPFEPENTASWADIEVPGMWQLQGYGHPHYTNIKFPFPVTPPNVSYINPTGSYFREFEVPDGWDGQQIRLRFEGVDSAFHVQVNGRPVGYSSLGSRNPSEFDITPYLGGGKTNNVSARVYQWSHGTYIEDQDQWWLSGIFRDVYLMPFAKSSIVDFQVHPELDAALTTGTLRTAVEIQGDEGLLNIKLLGPGGNNTIGEWDGPSSQISDAIFTVTGDDLHIWSAETPSLYTALMTFNGRTISQRLGFRRMERSADGSTFLVNGKAIKIYGVNRHEHHHLSGRTVPYAALRHDLLAMKRHNINAIRTSHQPPHPDFFDLADELGFYVIAEADLECHGFGDKGSSVPPESYTTDNPEWRDAYVNRAEQLVRRVRNHVSVIFWSLGNECFMGQNMFAMAEWIRAADPTRLIHYEQDYGGVLADVHSRMYSSPQWIREWVVNKTDKPLILCEYAHAMGNGPGSLVDYIAAFRSNVRAQGGLIWEWSNHGLLKKEGDLEYYAYGGDFGDFPNDADFIMDGLMLSDHSPMPSIFEYKKVIQPIVAAWAGEGSASGQVVITNHYGFVDSSHLEASWHVVQDGKKTEPAVLDVPAVAAGDSVTVATPLDDSQLEAGEAFLVLEFRLANATNWADQGHLVAWDQLHIPARAAAAHKTRGSSYNHSAYRPRAQDIMNLGQTDPTSNGTHLQVTAGTSTFGFDLLRGNVTWTVDGGPSILQRGPELSFMRASTQNDEAGGGDARQSWDPARVHELHPQVRDVRWRQGDDGVTTVHYRIRVAPKVFVWGVDADVVYTVDPQPDSGVPALTVRAAGSFHNDTAVELQTLPRIGLLAWLPAALDEVAWFGRGPHETYRDSKQAGRFGNWNATVDELRTTYDYPQENGNREDARWVSVRSREGRAALRASMVDSDGGGNSRNDAHGETFAFAAARYMPEDLNRAKHPHELRKLDVTVLNLDYRGNGLGSATVGPRPLEQYRCKPEPFDFTFRQQEMQKSFRAALRRAQAIQNQSNKIMAHRGAPRVPNTSQVVPGAAVNIVLKEDQPTGRTVSGAVRDVLTRANHPRGIKVRLSDGRVGRVQSLASASAVASSSAADMAVATEGPPRHRGMARDLRLDEQEYGAPPPERGLDAFVIKPAKVRGGKKKGKGGGGAKDGEDEAARSSTCPVCGEFEGDEAAVAHHVATHFD
ncbi:beta-galactosidase [Pyricularia oryzae Y34]|nr:beta-galactosidase [Pyricularia oryzae Y34]